MRSVQFCWISAIMQEKQQPASPALSALNLASLTFTELAKGAHYVLLK